MPPLNRPVDKDGFPIPVTFNEAAPAKKPRGGGQVAWIVRAFLLLAAMCLLVGVAIKAIGPNHIARWYHERAGTRYDNDDLHGAVADMDRALSWKPDDVEFYYDRARYREETNDLEGSLDDYDQVIKMRPNAAAAYSGRSTVYQRLERHREAIDDVTRAIKLSAKTNHTLLNHRAYTRAIANMELDEALADIQQAIDLLGRDEAAYLDTRGYIYYLLDRQEEALKDMDLAVQLAVMDRKQELQTAAARRQNRRFLARRERLHNESEAVMIYHRGLVHEKLGHTQQAEADKARGLQLGFNPAEGVY